MYECLTTMEEARLENKKTILLIKQGTTGSSSSPRNGVSFDAWGFVLIIQ